MHRTRKIVVGLVGLGVLVIVITWCIALLFGDSAGNRSAKLDIPVNQALIARGDYLAVAGDCEACHTATNGQPFAGGLPISTPVGVVYSTNITPDKTHGIGNYSYGDFERAVRRGITPRGHTLYPAMPYPSYARITDADMRALYAYFEYGVKPVAQKVKAPDIPWPLSIRWPLTYWRWLFAPRVPMAPEKSDNALRDRGAYLVEGLGHCGSCHTPRGFAFQEKALTDRDGPLYLSGGIVDHYVAGNLRGDELTGLGDWTQSDIVQFLKTGRNKNAGAFGGMSDVVVHSTQSMSDEDLRAIAYYLKSLPAAGPGARFTYDPKITTQLEAGDVAAQGALDYLNNCAACHRSTGMGYIETFPALAGNPEVNASDPSSLINIVLNGDTVPATADAPTHYTMPAFAWRLTDEDVANIATFVRSSWGNHAPPVHASEVARIRSATNAAKPQSDNE
ncbi:MAG: cytochrome c [Gammaproteobacteria bacterium]